MKALHERLDVCFYTSNASRMPLRSTLVERIFSASHIWFNHPDEVVRLDCMTGEEVSGRWGQIPDLVDEPLTPTQLLFVYAAHDANRYSEEETPPCVSMDAKEKRLAFSVSVPFTILIAREMRVVEQWIISLYEMLMEYGDFILAAGSEIELFADKSLAETVEIALGSNLNAGWIGLPTFFLKRDDLTEIGEIVHQSDTFNVYRRHDPVAWMRETYHTPNETNDAGAPFG